MPDSEQIERPIDSASERRYRSTPLRPAIWMTGILVWATVIALFFRIPTWAGIFLCILTGLSFLFYLGSYIFLMATDREVLRAEHYTVNRLPFRQRGLQVQIPRELLEKDQILTTRSSSRAQRPRRASSGNSPAMSTTDTASG